MRKFLTVTLVLLGMFVPHAIAIVPCPEGWTKVADASNPFPVPDATTGDPLYPAILASPVFYDCKMFVSGKQSGNVCDVWAYDQDTSTWTTVGGNGINGSWNTTSGIAGTYSMTVHDGELWVGLANYNPALSAEVYSFDGLAWAKRGGEGMNGSWPAAEWADECYGLTSYNGKLFCAVHFHHSPFDPPTYALRMYAWNGNLWSQVGGDSINGSWDNLTTSVPNRSLAPQTVVWNNKLYLLAHGYYGGNFGPELWEYDDSTSTWRTIILPVSSDPSTPDDFFTVVLLAVILECTEDSLLSASVRVMVPLCGLRATRVSGPKLEDRAFLAHGARFPMSTFALFLGKMYSSAPLLTAIFQVLPTFGSMTER